MFYTLASRKEDCRSVWTFTKANVRLNSYLPPPEEKKKFVRRMFDAVAPRYDLLNHVLSLGIDVYWRRQMLRLINFRMNPRLVDLATGTGDVALMAVKEGAYKVVGVDLSVGMLRHGLAKIRRKDADRQIGLVAGDAENLPLPSGSVDAVTIAFGIRNVSDIPAALREMCRVLKDSGLVVILEFSRPRLIGLRQLYHFYFLKILPWIGSLISHDKKAYHYLPHSVLRFPEREDFAALLREAGFSEVRYFDMTLGVVSVYCGMKA